MAVGRWMALCAVLFVALTSGAMARQEVTLECRWFGTAPKCEGSCPAGWTAGARSKTGDGERCIFGSKVRCCDLRNHCVLDYDSSFNPNDKQTLSDGTIQCKRCKTYGEDCKMRGGFNTACKRWEWVNCGKATPPPSKRPTSGVKTGSPILAPDPPGTPPPTPPAPECKAPHITFSNGVCGCPAGTRGTDCQNLIVH